MTDSGNTEHAPFLAPIKHGDREAKSWSEQQKRVRREMTDRMWGPMLALALVLGTIGYWVLYSKYSSSSADPVKSISEMGVKPAPPPGKVKSN